MNDGHSFRHDFGRALQKAKRRERLEIGRIAVQVGIEWVGRGHDRRFPVYSSDHCGARLSMKALIPSSASRLSMFSTMMFEVYR